MTSASLRATPTAGDRTHTPRPAAFLLAATEVELAAVVRKTMLPASVSIWINRSQE